MYDKILVAVDGSNESRAAARQALELARALGSSVVALHVAPPFHPQYFEDFVPPPATTRDLWQAGLRSVAERHFQPVKEPAHELGVALVTDVVFDDHTADAIVTAAQQHGCSLIVMGPRGRGGVAGYLLGSVSSRVMGISRIPVLLHLSQPA